MLDSCVLVINDLVLVWISFCFRIIIFSELGLIICLFVCVLVIVLWGVSDKFVVLVRLYWGFDVFDVFYFNVVLVVLVYILIFEFINFV